MAKNTIKITESKLREMVIEAVEQSLNEAFVDDTWDTMKNGAKKVGGKVKDGIKKVKDTFHDISQGYDTLEGNPENIEMVIKGDGWKMYRKPYNEDGATIYEIYPYLMHGISPERMAEEMRIFYDGKVKVSYTDHPKNDIIKKFRLEF